MFFFFFSFLNCDGDCQRLEYSPSLTAGMGQWRRRSDMSSAVGLSALTPSLSAHRVMGRLRHHAAHNGGRGVVVGGGGGD